MGCEDQKDKLVTGGDILELWKHVDVNRYFKEVRMHRVEVCVAFIKYKHGLGSIVAIVLLLFPTERQFYLPFVVVAALVVATTAKGRQCDTGVQWVVPVGL